MEEMNSREIEVILVALDSCLDVFEKRMKALCKKYRKTVSEEERMNIVKEVANFTLRYNEMFAILRKLSE